MVTAFSHTKREREFCYSRRDGKDRTLSFPKHGLCAKEDALVHRCSSLRATRPSRQPSAPFTSASHFGRCRTLLRPARSVAQGHVQDGGSASSRLGIKVH